MTCKHCGGDITEAWQIARVEEAAQRVVEHLGRASKAAIVDPLINQMHRAVARRFRAQRSAYFASRIISSNGSIDLSGEAKTRFRERYTMLTRQAYDDGAVHVAEQIAPLQESDILKRAIAVAWVKSKFLPGPTKTAQDLEKQIDGTTRDLIAGVLSNEEFANLGYATQQAQIRTLFRDWASSSDVAVSRSAAIATQEVSAAFHEGGGDVASIVADEGTAVEKSWDGEPDACEEVCQPNIDQGWIPEDQVFDSGDSEPPGHPHCRCSVSYRTVGQNEEAGR